MKKFMLLIGAVACLPIAAHGAFVCGVCKKAGKLFSNNDPKTMAMHLAYVHDSYWCYLCSNLPNPHKKLYKVIQGSQTYKKHVKDAHGKWWCQWCLTRTFETEEAYQPHKDASHLLSMEYTWRCPACKTEFPTIERFAIHTLRQHGIYVCQNCVQVQPDEKNTPVMRGFTEAEEFSTHMHQTHNEFVCLKCNMRSCKTQKDLSHYHEQPKIKLVKKGGCRKVLHSFPTKVRLHLRGLQQAYLLCFLKKTLCGYICCAPFHKMATDTYNPKHEYSKEEESSAIKAVQAFAAHVLKEHKCCLFCENLLTNSSGETLKTSLEHLSFKQIAVVARMFLQVDKDAFSKDEIPVIPCEMCGSALPLNRESRLFSSIREFPLGQGLDVRDYPFHHLEYDEQKVNTNFQLSVIGEHPENEEESHFQKEDEGDDVILGGEEAEDEEIGKEEAEDKKAEKQETEPKPGK